MVNRERGGRGRVETEIARKRQTGRQAVRETNRWIGRRKYIQSDNRQTGRKRKKGGTESEKEVWGWGIETETDRQTGYQTKRKEKRKKDTNIPDEPPSPPSLAIEPLTPLKGCQGSNDP